MAGGNLKISTGHEKSKFGIPIEQIDNILALVRKTQSLSAACMYIPAARSKMWKYS
jgi:diaminopimelate decarboxylase